MCDTEIMEVVQGIEVLDKELPSLGYSERGPPMLIHEVSKRQILHEQKIRAFVKVNK
jgi:hypothetical protein